MALIAGDRLVSAGERKRRLLVHGERVVRGLPGGSGMALLATVLPRIAGKLALVFILVAIDAECKLDFETSVIASGNMAVGALDFCVRRHEREARFGMICRGECGWAPAGYGVAAFAAPAIGALEELAAMRIRIVAIRALSVGDGQLEIAGLVAGEARHIGVFAQERVTRLGVIEGGGEGGVLPTGGGVAGLATLLELALVGIGVAKVTG